MGALRDLLSSAHGVFAVALVLGATALVITNKMTVDQWVDLAKWVFVTLAGVTAVTSAADSLANKTVTMVHGPVGPTKEAA